MFTISSISSGLEFWSVSHTSIYEWKVFQKYNFFWWNIHNNGHKSWHFSYIQVASWVVEPLKT